MNALPGPAELRPALTELERRLDPAHPEGAGVRVLGYGEISVALVTQALPGLVCKRMSGYRDAAAVSSYLDLFEEYLRELHAAGIRVVPSQALGIERPGRPPVVYLVQPLLPAEQLGHQLVHTADDHALAGAVRAVLDDVATLARASGSRTDGVEVAVDGQLANWWFGDSVGDGVDPEARSDTPSDAGSGAGPVLIDVGTPFLRRHGRHAIDREMLLAPVPPGARAYYRRRGLVEAYLDDYFVPRTVALDLLGNFHKEGASERIGIGEGVANEWLSEADVPGPRHPIHVDEVAAYYRKDADLLTLYLRARRADRFIRTKLLRQPYDFVLPGHVAR